VRGSLVRPSLSPREGTHVVPPTSSALSHWAPPPMGRRVCARTGNGVQRVAPLFFVPGARTSASLRCSAHRRRFTEAAALVPQGRGQPPRWERAGDRPGFVRCTDDPGCRLRQRPYHAARRAVCRLEQRADDVRWVSLACGVPVMAAGQHPAIEPGRCGGRARSARPTPLPSRRRRPGRGWPGRRSSRGRRGAQRASRRSGRGADS
jgi:hypothetical protein